VSTHDYTRRCWGHDFAVMRVIDDGQKLRLGGWGHGVGEGDYLILANGDSSTRYVVEEIEYCADPHDQWFATVRFAPREAVPA
jgi:hypothetical protein